MEWNNRLSRRLWAAFLVIALCVGFFVDILEVRSSSGGVLPEVRQVVTIALFYLALVGIPLGVGYIVYQWVGIWRDLRNDGPNIRRFKALSDSIGQCNRNLVSYLERSRESIAAFTDTKRQTEVSAEVNLVLSRLRQLKIPAPSYSQFEGTERSRYLVAYLAAMEQFAKWGDLRTARRRDLGEIVMRSDDDE